jgi:hypothetical protein
MALYLEKIAAGTLAKCGGGGAFSQLYNYNLIVCYTRDDQIFIATKDVQAHTIGGVAGYKCRAVHGDAEYGWTETKVFDHETPTGGDPTATVISPPVLWVARSGQYLPATTTPACTTNIVHLAWSVKYTSGANQDCYQVFHAMRKSDGSWTCAAGTLASLNAITTVSATTGQWKNVQMTGLRRWDPDMSRFEAYATYPTTARTTLYLTYWGRPSNAGTDPNHIYMAKFGSSTDGFYNGNDWDDTQTWQPYANHKQITSGVVYADELNEIYTLAKVARSTPPTGGGGSNTVYYQSVGSASWQYITVAYSRKGLTKSGGTRTDLFPVYKKYHPDTDVLDAETDVIANFPIVHTSGRTSATLSTPEQTSLIYDNVLLFVPKYGGSSGLNYWQEDQAWVSPVITGNLGWFETNRTRADKDGDVSFSMARSFNTYYLPYHWWELQGVSGYPMRCYKPIIQHGTVGVGENYYANHGGATGYTPSVLKYNLRTGASYNIKGDHTFIFYFAMRHDNYEGMWSAQPPSQGGSGTLMPPWNYPDGTGSQGIFGTTRPDHPKYGGTHRSYGGRYQIHALHSSVYLMNTDQNGYCQDDRVTWPQMGDYNCITPISFRGPWFQNGTMPYNMVSGNSFIFEAYKTDGVDNEVWFAIPGALNFYCWDNASYQDSATQKSLGFWFRPGYRYFGGQANPEETIAGDEEKEWIQNAASYNGGHRFTGELVARHTVRTTIRQDESSTNQIARPTYNVSFDFDIRNAEGLLVNDWQAENPYVFFGVSQYAAKTPCYIGLSVVNSVASVIRTSTVSGRAALGGTVEFALGSEGETHWNARNKVYASSVTLSTVDGATQYFWIKWTPPGGLTSPPTPATIGIYLRFDQLT